PGIAPVVAQRRIVPEQVDVIESHPGAEMADDSLAEVADEFGGEFSHRGGNHGLAIDAGRERPGRLGKRERGEVSLMKLRPAPCAVIDGGIVSPDRALVAEVREPVADLLQKHIASPW